MTKESFMQELARLLGDISPQERQEALNFYEEYFHDAGPEKEHLLKAYMAEGSTIFEGENLKYLQAIKRLIRH